MVLLRYDRFSDLFKVLILRKSVLLSLCIKFKIENQETLENTHGKDLLKRYTLTGKIYTEIFLKVNVFILYATNVIFSRISQYVSLNHSQAQGRIAAMFSWWFCCQILWLLKASPILWLLGGRGLFSSPWPTIFNPFACVISSYYYIPYLRVSLPPELAKGQGPLLYFRLKQAHRPHTPKCVTDNWFSL